MPDLVLTEDQKQYQQLAREFAENELAPQAEHCDEDAQTPTELLKKAWELGLFNARVPEQYGGLGLSLTDACVIAEELGSACTGISASFEGNEVAVAALLATDGPEKDEFLTGLTDSFTLAGYCTTPLEYEEQGGKYFLSGDTIAVNGTSAKWLIATARGAKGESTFIITDPSDAIKRNEVAFPFGRKAADIRRVKIAGGEATLLGEMGKGPEAVRRAFVSSGAYIAAEAVGMGRAALNASVKYAKERTTFGVPIGNHQGVAFMMADMAKDVEAGRLLYLKAAWLADNGKPSATQSMVARVFAIDAAMRIATDAVQVFGGYGYMREYPVEKLMRDAKVMQMMETTTHKQKVTLGKELVAV